MPTKLTMMVIAGAGLAQFPAGAVDGVILIGQNRTIAGSPTPRDVPGFAVTISPPGSYKLAGARLIRGEI